MPFTVFTESTTAYANEVMDNFYTIAQGDRLPRGGANLDPTTGVYNIGSASYYWDEVFCQSIDLSNSNKLETLISRQILSAAAQSVEFTGLAGDTNYELKLKYHNMAGASTGIYLLVNGVTAASFGMTRYTVDGWATLPSVYASTYSSNISNMQISYTYPTTTMNTASAIGVWCITPFTRGSSSSSPAVQIVGFLSGRCFDGAREWVYDINHYLVSSNGSTLTSIKIWSNTTTGIPVDSVAELWKK
jgi:hypothetical protein